MHLYSLSLSVQLTKVQRQASQPLRAFSTAQYRSSNTSTPHALHDQRLILPDGRTLGFSEFGRPDGYPLLFFHGWPSSRLEAWVIDTVARRRRLRVVSLERPGFGLSTFRPPYGSPAAASFQPRRIVDWPEDVAALANHLKLDRFAVLGGSGGGPFALACALKLPTRQMLSAVGHMAPAGPRRVDGKNGEEENDLIKDILWSQRATTAAANYFPFVLRTTTDGLEDILAELTHGAS